MSQAAPCVFCERPGSSEEDVFAKWIADLMRNGAVFNLRRAHGRSKTNLRYLGIKSRAACKTCNNEWMSQFEQTVQPLLTPNIKGEPTRWALPAEHTIVARWAFKTALMLDRSVIPDHWTTPDKDFKYLFKHQRPPPSVSILLGWYEPEPQEEVFAVWAGSARTGPGQKASTGEELDGYRLTFSVGHAIFQVYGLTRTSTGRFLSERTITMDGQLVRDAFRRLWPHTLVAHDWPPRGLKFTTSGLLLLEPEGS